MLSVVLLVSITRLDGDRRFLAHHPVQKKVIAATGLATRAVRDSSGIAELPIMANLRCPILSPSLLPR